MPAGPSGTKAWLKGAGIRPKKSWGQNFLVNPRVAARLAGGWELGAARGVLEVGAGAGSLTLPMLHAGAAVLAVERDPALCALLERRIACEAPGERAQVLAADILALEPARAIADFRERLARAGAPAPGEWALAGNLPYRFTTPILVWTARNRALFRWVAFMVQREYGQRLLARAGTGEFGSLTLWMGLFFRMRRQARVGPGNFWPVPKVDSVVVRLEPHLQPPVAIPAEDVFARVLRAAFGQRRKMIAGALAGGLRLPRLEVEAALALAGVDGRRRAEECDLAQFAALSRALSPLLGRGAEPPGSEAP